MRNKNITRLHSWYICRTVFLLSEALDEQLKTLWFSPFQTDEIESDLEMVRACLFFLFVKLSLSRCDLSTLYLTLILSFFSLIFGVQYISD